MSRFIDADLIEYEPMCRAMGNGMYEDCETADKDQIDDIPTAGGVVDGANYVKFKHGLLGIGRCFDVDICDDCIQVIKEEVEKRRGDHA